MKTNRFFLFLAWLVLTACAFTAQAQSAAEPTVHDIYQKASSGDLAGANAMVDQVIARHPDSGKAHYVKAELAARGHDAATARSELRKAEQLAPGLPFAKADAVSALRREIEGASTSSAAPHQDRRSPDTRNMGAPPVETQPRSGGLHLGSLVVPVLLVGAVLMFLRRRRSRPMASGPMATGPIGGPNDFGRYPQQPYPPQGQGGYPGPYPQGYPQGYPQREGMGSSIARGVGTGLAIGAGAVAAQEIGRRMFDHEGNPARDGNPLHDRSNAADSQLARDAGLGGGGFDPDLNQDMGGQDFGIQDAGGWDDGGFGDVGGDDWNQ